MKTITLPYEMSFKDALQALKDGKGMGMRPGANTNYVELFHPAWMNDLNDAMLRWKGGDSEIRMGQILRDDWKLVIIDHRTITKTKDVAI